MKYSFLLFAGMAMVLVCSAQNSVQSRPRQSAEILRYPSYWVSGTNTASDIEHFYDMRVQDVERDAVLSPHKKKKMIRDINEERKIHLKAVLKYERKEARKKWKYLNAGRL
jgi:hypothetical protein